MNFADIWKTVLAPRRVFVSVTLLSWIAAGLYWVMAEPPFKSEAKLMISYILHRPEIDGPTEVSNTTDRIDGDVAKEVELLTSRELAEEVTGEIGPERLTNGSGESDPHLIISRGFTVTTKSGGPVIDLEFKHADADTAQATLSSLLKNYFIAHRMIAHRMISRKLNGGVMEALLVGSEPGVSLVQSPSPPVRERRFFNVPSLIAGGPIAGAIVVTTFALLKRRRPVRTATGKPAELPGPIPLESGGAL